MAVILWLAACRVEPPPAPRDLCPELDWVVHVGSSIGDDVQDVVALPGGDVLVAGVQSGAAQIGTREGDTLPPTGSLYNPFVARLGPDGAMRWSHTMRTGFAGRAGRLSIDADGFWFAGEHDAQWLAMDGQTLLTLPDDPVPANLRSDAFAARFDLDGRFERLVTFAWPGLQHGEVAVGRPDGTVVLVGGFSSDDIGIAGLGGPFANAASGSPLDSDQDLFAVAFDRDDDPIWLSAMTEQGIDGGHSWNETGGWWGPDGPRFATAVAVSTRFPSPVWSTTREGSVPNPLRPLVPTNHFTYDLRTADVSELGFSLPGAHVTRLRPGRTPGTFLAVGELPAPATYTGADGVPREVTSVVEGFHVGFVGEFDPEGRFTSLTTGSFYADGGDRTPAGDAVLVGHLASAHPLAPGLPGLDPWTDDHRDAYVARFRDDHLQCAWSFTGPNDQDLRDAAVDDLGGLVVGGSFTRELEIRDFDGNVIHTLGSTDYATDGVLARFLPPED